MQCLHLAALPCGTIFQQALGATEGVVRGEMWIVEALVDLRRVIDVDVDAARQGHVDMNAERAAVAVRGLDDDGAGGPAARHRLPGPRNLRGASGERLTP